MVKLYRKDGSHQREEGGGGGQRRTSATHPYTYLNQILTMYPCWYSLLSTNISAEMLCIQKELSKENSTKRNT